MKLEKKRVVILGGSSGIGLAVAKLAAQAGAELVVVSSRKENIERALADLPQSTQGHTVDLSEEMRVRALFEVLGPFDHLVYTAGENLKLGALKDTNIDEARRFWTLRLGRANSGEIWEPPYPQRRQHRAHVWARRPAPAFGMDSSVFDLWSDRRSNACACCRACSYSGQRRLAGRRQNTALGQHERSRSQRTLPADEREAPRRACGRKRRGG